MNIKHAVAISINSEPIIRYWETKMPNKILPTLDNVGMYNPDYDALLDIWQSSYKEVKVHESHRDKLNNILWAIYTSSLSKDVCALRTSEFEEYKLKGITISPELIGIGVDCETECGGMCGTCNNTQLFAFIKEAKEETNEAELWEDVYNELDELARDVDSYDYGLPFSDRDRIISIIQSKFTIKRK